MRKAVTIFVSAVRFFLSFSVHILFFCYKATDRRHNYYRQRITMASQCGRRRHHHHHHHDPRVQTDSHIDDDDV